MCVPLRDQSGKVRYYLGAQLDITDLVINCTELSSFRKFIEQQEWSSHNEAYADADMKSSLRDEFDELSESFDPHELEKLSRLSRRPQSGSVEGAEIAEPYQQSMPLKSLPVHHDNDFYLREQGSGSPLGFYQNVRYGFWYSFRVSTLTSRSIFLYDHIHHFVSYSLPLIYAPPVFYNHLS